MKWPWSKSKYVPPAPQEYETIKTELTLNEMGRIITMVEETYAMSLLMLQAQSTLLANTGNAQDAQTSALIIQQVCSSVGKVFGEDDAIKVADAYTGGRMSQKRELIKSGLTEQQALEWVLREKGDKFDA